MKKVLILCGGTSNEHEISLKSAKTILKNINYDKYDVTTILITKKNDWYLYDETPSDIENENIKDKNLIYNPVIFLRQFDIVFPILHGKDGEDGKIQGFLDLFNIKYVGCNTLSSAIGMDKHIFKIFCESLNVKTTPYQIYYKGQKSFPNCTYPVIIKPCKEGSSIGISTAKSKKELKKGLKKALKYDNKVLIEKFIYGIELECAIIKIKEKYYMNLGEIIKNHEINYYDAKYKDTSSKTEIVEDLEEIKETIYKNAKKIFENLNGRNLSRIDFLYDVENNQLYVNEINTLPGFTEISMYPTLIADLGFSLTEIIDHLLEN